MTTLIPAYGRDFKTVKAARESWNNNQDWIIADAFHQYDGKPVNKTQADEAGMVVILRFNGLSKTCGV